MRVGIVCGYMGALSGTPLHVAQQTAALREAGCDVELVHLDEVHPGLSGYVAHSARSVGTGRGPLIDDRQRAEGLYSGLCERVDGGDPFDIVHAHYQDAGLAALFMDVCHDVPYVFSLHGYEARNAQGRAFQRKSLESALAGASVVAPVSRAVLLEALDRSYREPRQVVVIPDGYDAQVFHPHTAAFDGDRLRVGFVGRGVPEKGLTLLCEAMSYVIGAFPHAVLVAAGAGTREVIERSLDQVPGLRGHVEVHDEIPHAHVARLLRTLDVLAVPSRFEGRGTVVLEALATGIPIVASAVGGLQETITPGADGLLVPPGSPTDLAQALIEVATDPVLAQRLSVGALETSWQFNWKTIATRLLDVYDLCLSSRAAESFCGPAPWASESERHLSCVDASGAEGWRQVV